MKMLYIAANGDGVGEQIGNAIMSDDHQALSGLSRKFKDAHSSIEKWAQRKGGEIVASSGDEVIFSLPEEAVGGLEAIKEAYAQASGTTLTIGIGATISQASKALIYGKLNEKNQIVEYEPQMEDYISGEDEQDVVPSPEEIDESASEEGRHSEGLSDDGEEEEFGEDDELDEGGEFGKPSSELVDENELGEDEGLEDEGLEDEGLEDEGEFEDEGDILDEESTQPPHEQGLDEEEDLVHDAEENQDDEEDDDNIEADAEPEVFGGNTEPLDDDFSEDVDEDIENQITDESEDIPELSEEDLAAQGESLDGEEDPMMEDEGEFEDEGLEDEGEFEDEAPIMEDGMSEEPMIDEEGQEGQEGQDELGSDADSFLNEMMHSNMDEEGGQQDPEVAGLKEKIFTALQSIKDNKEMLDQIKTQNPDLYQGIIANIQSMIEMGKKLGLDSGSQEPEMEEPQMEENPEDPEMMEDPSMQGDELDEEEQFPVKKPQGSFPA